MKSNSVHHFFKVHKESNNCFETSDGIIFHKREDATAHSFNLTDKSVKEHKRSDIATEFISKEAKALAQSQADTAKVQDAKNEEQLQSIAAGKIQQAAEDEVSESAEETAKAAAALIEKDVATGTDDDAEQAKKNAAAVVANIAANEGAGKVKTNVTAPHKKAPVKKAAAKKAAAKKTGEAKADDPQ